MPQLWQKYGLQVNHILFSSGAENNQALISGACHINVGSDSKTVELFSALEGKVVIIGVVQRGNRYATIVRSNAPYKTWSDLKGKTVATRFGTGAEQVLRRYFEINGMSWKDYRWVNMKLEDMIGALQSGSIEAFTVWEPTCAIAEAKGVGRVLRSYGDISPVPVCLHTTREFAQAHRAEIVRFLAAHLDKADLIRKNPRQAARIAAKAAGEKGYEVSPQVFEQVFKRIDFSLEINDDALRSIRETAQFLYDNKKISRIPAIQSDASFLEEAKALRKKTAKP
jgi:NitT/TauT family transport system substrate-binding protein